MTLELGRHGWVQILILPLPSKADMHLKRRKLVEETKAGVGTGQLRQRGKYVYSQTTRSGPTSNPDWGVRLPGFEPGSAVC